MKNYRSLLLLLSLATLPIFAVVFYRALNTEPTLATLTETADKAGEAMLSDLRSIPVKEIKEEEESYIIEEDGKDGIDISFASSSADPASSSVIPAKAGIQDSGSEAGMTKPQTTLSLPKDYGKPIEVRLDDQRTVLITDLNGTEDYSSAILSDSLRHPDPTLAGEGSRESRSSVILNTVKDLVGLDSSSSTQNDEQLGGSTSKYLAYTSPDERKTHLYAYQKDQASGEKKLKSWTLYDYGLGKETESYKIENAKIKIDEDGNADVFFFGQNDIQSEQAKADVDPSLMDRAQKFLEQETGNDIMNDTDRTPDFTIPRPTYFTKDGVEHEAEWKILDPLRHPEPALAGEGSSSSVAPTSSSIILSVALTENPDAYPIALDPTLAFTAPGSTSGGGVITGEGGSFGGAMASGDFNADGRMDLAVGAYNYNPGGYTGIGRVYIFYNDSAVSSTARNADVSITGEVAYDYFSVSITSGDFNQDGKTDLAAGANDYASGTGRAYIFYNDGSYPAAAANANVIITGSAMGDYFGSAFVSGDVNADGETDLVVSGTSYSTQTGRTYIFYGGSIVTEASSGADIIITGESVNGFFGSPLVIADLNADGKADLAIGAHQYDAGSGNEGRVYVFWNDGSFGSVACTTDCLASNADVRITGEANGDLFAGAIAIADLNADGKTDLAIGARGYSTDNGRAYIFYNGSIITENASGADVIITGGVSYDRLGYSLAIADFNADGRTDLAVGGSENTSSDTYHVYIFYNDGSYPATSSSADIVITGETTNTYFGSALVTADLNADGRADLIVGASGYASGAGKVYIFYSQNGTVNTNRSIAGESTNQDFGSAFAVGDFNADGKADLAIGAKNYDTGSSNVGRVYLFYSDGSYPTGGASADAIITGEATVNFFGAALTSGDFNADGKIDLVVGAYGYEGPGYTVDAGRAYIFYNGSIITENASGADIALTGEDAWHYFGAALTSGDFNADGKTDLAAGAYQYDFYGGRAYVFYGGSMISESASGADVIISNESASSYFGTSLTTGDFNADGKDDLAVSAYRYTASFGRVHIFYGGSIVTENASGADVILTGSASSSYFGYALAVGDFNTDGKDDLAVGAYRYSTYTGRVHVFYGGSMISESASGADVTITGEATNNDFGYALISGDFNQDGRTDLAVGADIITTNTGKTYIFHNDGSGLGTVACTTGCLAANADIIITGETTSNYFGAALVSGDFNADGRTDLVVGAYGNSTNTGKIYFYETRESFAWDVQPVSGLRTSPSFAGQEMKITGESGTTGNFGNAFATGDFNQDGKTDLAVGASAYNSNAGRAYLFYNDGTLASGAPSADVIISGESSSNFGKSLVVGDFNADGKMDLAVGASGYSSSNGRAYLFYQDGSYPSTAASADVIITGESGSLFGFALAAGDFNADGKTDLVTGAYAFYGGSGDTGRAYIFYSGSIITEAATGADVIITGDGTFRRFGYALATGDFNRDGETDLAVGAYDYPGNGPGRVYLFWNDGSYPSVASSADVVVSGESDGNNPVYFGTAIGSADFDADGDTDLVVGSYSYSYVTTIGRAYIFYADGTNNFGTATCSGTPAACSAANADVIITGESGSSFGYSLAAGDFNQDGRIDLSVGGHVYSTNTGRAYLFYNDGSIPTTAATADLILQGEATSNYYGTALAAGDFNADGKTDLVVGAYGYSSNKGRAYLYTFQDGVITGEASNNAFGTMLVAGDFNADGKTDLAVGANQFSSNTGRAYLFYNDGLNYPTAAASADVIITGETTNNMFGTALIPGDFNADGKTDLAVGAYWYSSFAGRTYIFYSDGSYPTAAASADVIITGEASSYFGYHLAAGDFNADGKTDIAVGASAYSSSAGRAYIFYSGSIITEAATGADVIITGESSSGFGYSLASGDFNADGKTDLAVGADSYSSNSGRAYVFYNGSIITEAATGADVIVTGEGGLFGSALAAGDWNADGKTDLAVSAWEYSYDNRYVGRVYLFHNDGSYPTAAASADVIVTGEECPQWNYYRFGTSLAAGDFNADGKTDLAVSAYGYSSSTGRTYIFYNDGSYPTGAASADVIITGETTSNYFGSSLASGDFNADGKTDLAVGAHNYSSNTGRAYLYITEARSAPTDQALKIKGGFKTKGGFRVR